MQSAVCTDSIPSTTRNDDVGEAMIPKTGCPRMYIIITNISKRPNIRSLLQAAAAFQCEQILVVGQKNFNFEPTTVTTPSMLPPTTLDETTPSSTATKASTQDDEKNVLFLDNETTLGTTTNCGVINTNVNHTKEKKSDLPRSVEQLVCNGIVRIRRMNSLDECVQYLQQQNILLIGVEIHEESKLLQELLVHYFHEDGNNSSSNNNNIHCHSQRQEQQLTNGSVPNGFAFVFGNEGTGLNDKCMNVCHHFVRIPQYGYGTASLNVATAASIIMYQFHMFQRKQQQQKWQERG